jgi:hypothetical protein
LKGAIAELKIVHSAAIGNFSLFEGSIGKITVPKSS